MPGTCHWIEDKGSFKWLLADDSQNLPKYLWLKGHPATGKSVLVSSIVDRLQEVNRPCGYYFFRFNDARKRTTRAFLLSSAYQFALLIPQYYALLLLKHDETSKIPNLSNRVLWQKLFVDILFDIELPTTCFWIIDALDEAENVAEITAFLGKIKRGSGIKILFVSRYDNNLGREFGKLKYVYERDSSQPHLIPS